MFLITHALHILNCICRQPQTTDAENNYKTRKKMFLFTHALHVLNCICRRPQTTDVEKVAGGLRISNMKAK
jgi:hypothetical protein